MFDLRFFSPYIISIESINTLKKIRKGDTAVFTSTSLFSLIFDDFKGFHPMNKTPPLHL